jgi:hypothetical protein
VQQWLGQFLSWAQVAAFGLTAVGVWIFAVVPDIRAAVLIIFGFLMATTDGSWSRALSPLEKVSPEPVGDGGIFWPGFVVFFWAVLFALGLRVSRDGLAVSVAASIAAMLLLTSLILVSLRLSLQWFMTRKNRRGR